MRAAGSECAEGGTHTGVSGLTEIFLPRKFAEKIRKPACRGVEGGVVGVGSGVRWLDISAKSISFGGCKVLWANMKAQAYWRQKKGALVSGKG